jgi:ubiquinone/menaquinone biosynthesis C-methylase UbiE
MSYAIDEQNLKRQRLLARILNPLTAPHLEALDVDRTGRWLDVGAGLGETTRLLTQFLDSTGECIGLEQDPALIQVARDQEWGDHEVTFREGDAMALPFDADSFDFVFTRFLLVHLPDPLIALREMFRVAKPGALVFAQEPDLVFSCCYPSSRGYERMLDLFQGVVADAETGRKLVHLFREVGDGPLQVRGDIVIETEGVDLRQIFTLTFEAIGRALVAAGDLDSAEYESLLADFRRVEADPDRVLIGNPIISVWGQASATNA